MPPSPIKLSANIADRDLGLNRLLEDLVDDTDAVDIGLLAGEKEEVLIAASANEFGTRHIPERSFIRAGVDENEAQINAAADRLWKSVIDGRITKAQALAKMGGIIQRHVQRKITTLRTPPNALSTIKKKAQKKGRAKLRAARKKGKAEFAQVASGFDNPLIDTGRMHASIQWILAKSSDGEAGI